MSGGPMRARRDRARTVGIAGGRAPTRGIDDQEPRTVIARAPRPLRSALSALTLAGVLAATAVGCASSGDGGDGDSAPPTSPRAVVPPEPHVGFDYQIGGPYPPPPGVGAVSRDRTAKPADGLYNICYVNAFQAQPDATEWWQEHHPDLLLRSASGDLVVDQDWDEVLFDISTPAKRERLAAIVGAWIDGCATAGYQAVEADNLDSYERSQGRLTPEHDLAFARLLVGRAHAAGLAMGQKNAAELAPRGRDIGFDFAVAEECGQYDECAPYATAFDNRVLVIEYEREGLSRACARWGGTLSIVLRDTDVRPAGVDGHVRATC
ncbi:endo alpha-1,4 polygalactosaminidase [Streptomyces sp. NPDC056543]|uniref:endo alpha-1,4 polygalactosaminidase n=1 Tax=unclassified Streptomyces TaxID=2593676 RepID=UPI0036B9FB0B